jgi:DNA-binding transcriptional regulator GbsR (MarR family)
VRKKVKAECDECGFNFTLKVRKKEVKEGVKKVYFKCPKCKTEFTSFYENETVKQLMKSNRELLNKKNNTNDDEARQNMEKEYNDNMIKIMEEQEKIKKSL